MLLHQNKIYKAKQMNLKLWIYMKHYLTTLWPILPSIDLNVYE